jgi:cytochrome d ubiquinol oxidase subunit I
MGRQPWLVTGVLRTADAAGDVPAPMIASTLAGYLTLYVVLGLSYVLTLRHMARLAAAGDPVKTADPRPDATLETSS